MIVQNQIETKLQEAFAPEYLQVENESHMHAVPANSETHFKATIVSALFDGQRLLARHRKVNQLLAQELAGPVHALALHTYTPQEWTKHASSVPDSPNCLGGSKG
jgi:BolA protein